LKKISNILASAVVAFSVATIPVFTQARSSVEKQDFDIGQDLMRSVVKTTPFAANTSYAVCFTPGQDCEGLIVSEIKHAQQSILLQAYSFTSAPIAKALMEAKQRGVDVRAILDKSQRTEKYTGATFLKHAGIPVVIDEKPAIAHSKIFVFDQQSVLTGSFNFTRSAQERNAENLIVIKGDANLVRAYTENWNSRWKVSVDY
jgi:phosphatidylserine/phosphatidylglycerophosphate/cardiolipin synthase-like enzyme